MTSSEAESFHLFPRLPPELRNRIWQFAIPSDIENVMFTYRPDCWQPKALKHPNLELCTSLLGKVSLNFLVALTNREAYSLCHEWLRRNGLSFDSCGRSFSGSFRVERDTLLIPLARYEDFTNPDLWDERPCNHKIARVAYPEAVFREEHLPFWNNFNWYWCFDGEWEDGEWEPVVIIVDAPPELGTLHDGPIHDLWDYSPLPGGRLNWNPETMQIEPEISGDTRYEVQARLIKSATTDLAVRLKDKEPWKYILRSGFQLVTVTKRVAEC